MHNAAATAHFRPNRQVLNALRAVRAQGLARRLGTISPGLVERLANAASVLDETAAARE